MSLAVNELLVCRQHAFAEDAKPGVHVVEQLGVFLEMAVDLLG